MNSANKETNISNIADEFNIPYINSIWDKDNHRRNEYETIIISKLKVYSPDLVSFSRMEFCSKQ